MGTRGQRAHTILGVGDGIRGVGGDKRDGDHPISRRCGNKNQGQHGFFELTIFILIHISLHRICLLWRSKKLTVLGFC
jgi:hypothetical protein